MQQAISATPAARCGTLAPGFSTHVRLRAVAFETHRIAVRLGCNQFQAECASYAAIEALTRDPNSAHRAINVGVNLAAKLTAMPEARGESDLSAPVSQLFVPPTPMLTPQVYTRGDAWLWLGALAFVTAAGLVVWWFL